MSAKSCHGLWASCWAASFVWRSPALLMLCWCKGAAHQKPKSQCIYSEIQPVTAINIFNAVIRDNLNCPKLMIPGNCRANSSFWFWMITWPVSQLGLTFWSARHFSHQNKSCSEVDSLHGWLDLGNISYIINVGRFNSVSAISQIIDCTCRADMLAIRWCMMGVSGHRPIQDVHYGRCSVWCHRSCSKHSPLYSSSSDVIASDDPLNFHQASGLGLPNDNAVLSKEDSIQ